MPSFAFDYSQWREQLTAYLPAQVRTLIQGASGRDLVKKIETSFLLFDNKIVHLESREAVELKGNGALSITAACAELLTGFSADQRKECAAVLLLPANFFVATTTTMPGVAKENLVSALKIQADSILPSLEVPLSLAINPLSATQGDEHLALWMTESTLSDLFDAFAEKDIFLAAVKPRFMNGNSEDANDGNDKSDAKTRILDVDAETETCVVIEDSILKSLFHVRKQDLQQEVFQQQWQETLKRDSSESAIELDNVSDYFSRLDVQANQEYCFFPHGALNATRRTAQGKQYIAAAAVVIAALFIAAVPFILQSLEFRSLASTLEMQRAMASDARQDQAAVVSFENEWGLISDFPEQRLREAMFTLQNILRPDTLTSMEVSEGLIKIQGSSNEPQAILQRLEQDPMFTEVVFSRATNNQRYYIDLRISTVNFEGYMVRYFPDE
ncbi:MAG: hypothetical protein COB20_09120 [SAR86 cluster bacterium]|uniref:GspL cytoplasmic actin-ATPase-like domain-containing protein n=1 Tax=SAR86 cluster bacterium TaxID=2030880 RepID=A0A2A4X3A7_9GAMM|nr:MAG: hypothetical protein COB20_09120 [SAR86 cluster bacterium]